jgi:hypothetical protein
VSDAKRLQRTLEELFATQPDDQRLRDHLEGVARDEAFPGLTWFWGPTLYARNRVVFRGLILNHFSDWQQTGRAWKRIAWSDHANRLQAWLDAARSNRDAQIVRRLLRWKHADRRWGLDQKSWNAALLHDYRSAPTPAARAIVLDEYDDWFELDEGTALSLYQCDRNCSAFLLKHLPNSFWSSKRELWERLLQKASDTGDTTLHFELYRRQVPQKRWSADVLSLARQVRDAAELCDELERRHPVGYGLSLSKTIVALLELRGRDVMPYVRGKLKDLVGGWYGDRAKPLVDIAEKNGWWDLWAAAIRVDRDDKLFHAAVADLLGDAQLAESERIARLQALSGVSREWNWPGLGLVQVYGLDDSNAVRLYRRYPELIHGPYKPHVTPTWWHGYPKLLAAAQEAGDDELVDLMASRYATQVRYEHGYFANKERDRIMESADSLGDY